MPIKGLIEVSDTSIRQGLPEIARCYKGEKQETRKRKDGTEYKIMGKDLEYFRVEFNPQFAEFEEVFRAMYTDEDGVYEPDLFERVHVAAETTDEAFDFWMEQWNSTMTLLHKCDGDTQVRWFDERKKMYSNGTMACASKPDNTQPPCECTRVGRLALILTDFTAATGVFGYFLFQTHSINDIITLYQTLSMAEKLARKAGRSLMGVPFTFGRATEQISAPHAAKNKQGEYERTGKRIKVNKSLFYLHTDPEFTKQVLLPALVSAPALPATVPAAEEKIVSIERGSDKIRKTLGAGGGEPRRMGATPDQTDVIQGEVTDVTEAPKADTPTITRTFVCAHAKYIMQGTYSYLSFVDPNDQPGVLYMKDFEKRLDPLGPEFQKLHMDLRPVDNGEQLTLPESLTVTVEAKTNGKAYWEVTDLKRVEQAQEGGQVAS